MNIFANTNMLKKNRATMPPCKTFSEMAEELGLTQQQLTAHVKRSTIPFPAAELARTRHHVMWLNPRKVRAWWAAHNEASVCSAQ